MQLWPFKLEQQEIKMVILGIDPGSRSAGFGLVRQDGKKIILLASGVMRYDFAGNFVDRLAEIYNSCNELRDKYIPDEIAIESLIYVKSVSSLAQVGIILLLFSILIQSIFLLSHQAVQPGFCLLYRVYL